MRLRTEKGLEQVTEELGCKVGSSTKLSCLDGVLDVLDILRLMLHGNV